ncbi:MAG: nucleotidyltransferase domain-containing protein [Candidatus Shapirobacteria bacterium]|jgi:predicted nucleotidyltransferase
MEKKKAVERANFKKIIKMLQLFKKDIRESGCADARCVLFGSWAKGKQTRDSDIDVCVISKNIKDRYDDRVKMAMIGNKYNVLIEPVAMLPQDLEDRYYTLASG